MKRKIRWTRRILTFLLLPLFTVVFSTVAYGVWQNHITFNINLTSAQKPTVAITSALLNTYNNSINLFVNSTTRIIETTTPPFPLIHINITNTGKTPIDKITLNETIPNNWTLREVCMQLVQANQTRVEINAAYFTIEYSPKNNVIITISSIKKAIGKTLNQNEAITVSLYIQYKLIGQPIPPGYEINPPTYTNTVKTTVGIGNWQSQPTTSTLAFATNIIGC